MSQNKFAIVPSQDGNNQIIKYSDEYIERVLNNMMTKHIQEVKETYWLGEVLTPEGYKEKINKVRETLDNQRIEALKEFDKQHAEFMEQSDETLSRKQNGRIAEGFDHRRQMLSDSYVETMRKEIQHIKDDKKKEKQFLRLLDEKKQQLQQYKTSKQIVIDQMKQDIIKYKRSLQFALSDCFKFSFEDKIKTEFDTIEDEADIEKVIKQVSLMNEYKQVIYKFVSYSDYLEKSLSCWLYLIPKLDITENKQIKIIKDEMLMLKGDLSHHICYLIENIISEIDNAAFVAAGMMKDYAEYIIKEIYQQFTNQLVPQIDEYYNKLYSRKTRAVLSHLLRYKVDLGEEVKQYIENSADWYENEPDDWKTCFIQTGSILKLFDPNNKPNKPAEQPQQPQQPQQQQALPQPQPQPEITHEVEKSEEEAEEIEEVEEINISEQKVTTTNDKSFYNFVQTLPNDEISINVLVDEYNRYFEAKITPKSICQKKEFKQYFRKSDITHIENRKRVPYYVKI